jgi:hypothetical protein
MGSKSSLILSHCLFDHNEAMWANRGKGGALQGEDGSCLEEARDVNFTSKGQAVVDILQQPELSVHEDIQSASHKYILAEDCLAV